MPCHSLKSTGPSVQGQSSYTPTSTGIDDQAFEEADIEGEGVEIKNFTDNYNGGTYGAWVPIKSTAFQRTKIRGTVRIDSQSRNGQPSNYNKSGENKYGTALVAEQGEYRRIFVSCSILTDDFYRQSIPVVPQFEVYSAGRSKPSKLHACINLH